MKVLRELLALREGAVQYPRVTMQVAAAMKKEWDATFTDAQYLEAAAWLINPRKQAPNDTVSRVIRFFTKMHGRDITSRGAKALMYQQFVSKLGLDKAAYNLSQKDVP